MCSRSALELYNEAKYSLKIVQKKIASVDEGITVYACVYIRDDRYQDGNTKMGFA